ncbi:MAG: putative membrane protein YfcA [Candidatus Azotimanducaceae bacterium]
METDPLFYLSAILAVLIVGVAKGGLAGGIGIVAVPLMSLTIDPLKAAAIMLPILMLMDGFALKTYWKKWDVQNLKYMIPGAVMGTLIGWVTFQYLSPDLFKLLIGVLAISFGLNFFLTKSNQIQQMANQGKAIFWSSISGITSFAIHAGGPPLFVYLLPQKVDKTKFQATTVAFFFIINWLKIGPYAVLGQLDANNVTTSLVLSPIAPLGIILGAWLHTRINETYFYRIVYVSLIGIGTKLVYDGLS